MRIDIVGASGVIGTEIIKILNHHPELKVGLMCASSQREYYTTHHYIQPHSLVLSALPNSVAPQIEGELMARGCTIISNASYDRLQPDVPLIHPDVNMDALTDSKRICVPNCVSTGLAVALKSLICKGLRDVHVTSMQAISGAGYPGVASLDILSNIDPYIRGEEEKVESEPNKLLSANLSLSATCVRVPVEHGHLQSVSVRFDQPVEMEEIEAAWGAFYAIDYRKEDHFPQPKRHLKPMEVSIGRLRKCSNFDYKFVILSHNLIQGAAGASVKIAEKIYERRNTSKEKTHTLQKSREATHSC